MFSAENGKNERLITSVPYARHSASAKKQSAGEALKAAGNALKRYFGGDPQYPIAKLAEKIDFTAQRESLSSSPENAEKIDAKNAENAVSFNSWTLPVK